MNNVLIVVDMQNDFVSGSLGSPQAQAIVPGVVQKIKIARDAGTKVVFTLDTHGETYLTTREGKSLPVSHCIKGTDGWNLCPEVAQLADGKDLLFEKNTFGSLRLAQQLAQDPPDEIELVGLCTDICVVSNALLLKAFLPEVPISVDASCCAGVTPESHRAALDTMKSCQITIL